MCLIWTFFSSYFFSYRVVERVVSNSLQKTKIGSRDVCFESTFIILKLSHSYPSLKLCVPRELFLFPPPQNYVGWREGHPPSNLLHYYILLFLVQWIFSETFVFILLVLYKLFFSVMEGGYNSQLCFTLTLYQYTRSNS